MINLLRLKIIVLTKTIFLSTPDEEKSLDFLVDIDIDLIKIGSGETNNLIFLEQVAKKICQ